MTTSAPAYRYPTAEESLALYRSPLRHLPPGQLCGVSLLVKIFDVPARLTNRHLNTWSLELAQSIHRSRKLRWRVAFFAVQCLAVTIQALQVAVLGALYRHKGGVLNSSTNVRVVARRGEAPISVGGLLGVATHGLFGFGILRVALWIGII